MGKNGEPLVYKDLWYGDITSETNLDFEKHHLIDLPKFKSIFTSLGFKIVSISKPPRSSIYFATIVYKNQKYNIIFETLKHSGSHDNRIRAHISPNSAKSAGDNQVFLFGGYNSGDEIIFVVSDITEFVKKTSIQKNNSSFWIGTIDDIIKVYKNQEVLWYRSKDNALLHGTTLTKLKKYNTETIIEKFLLVQDSPDTPEQNDEVNLDLYNVEPEHVDVDQIKKLKKTQYLNRNPLYREIALEMANYTCELCGKDRTFEDAVGKEYFEGHHLIMYNVNSQSRFDKSLDIPRNIICLCPECHKKIHFAKDTEIKDLVIKLFMKHRDLFKIYEIESLDEILKDYIDNREENGEWA